MNYYSIAAVAEELGVHESSLRRWEERELIFPERINMGKTTVRIYSKDDLELLRRGKELMHGGMNVGDAFRVAHNETANQEEQKQ